MPPDALQQTISISWITLVESLGPTLVGITGFVGVIWSVREAARLTRQQHERELEHERKGLAAALMGEIASILTIVHFRNYVDHMQDAVDRVNAGQSDLQVVTFYARRDYFEVFSGNVHKLGLLPGSLAEKVVRLYTACKSILEDADQLHEGLDADERMRLQRMEEMLDLLVAARDLAVSLVKDLAEMSGQPVPGIVGLIERENQDSNK